jgi:flagellin
MVAAFFTNGLGRFQRDASKRINGISVAHIDVELELSPEGDGPASGKNCPAFNLEPGESIMGNSVNTNMGALVALRNLDSTNRVLDRTQDRVSTGYKVIGAKDNASSFAIAEGLRANLKGFTAVQQALANGKGIGEVAIAGATKLSSLLQDMKAKVLEGMNAGNTSSQQSILAADFVEMKAQFATFIANSSYNGKNLLMASASDAVVISTISGGTLSVTNQSAIGGLTFGAMTTTATAASALVDVDAAITSVGTALGSLGADVKSLSNQQDFLKTLSDATTEGLGSIVDADLAEESAMLQSLQVKQQLGVQALSIANGAPQILLSLFR